MPVEAKAYEYKDLPFIIRHLYENRAVNIFPLIQATKRPAVKELTPLFSERSNERQVKNHKGNFGIISGDPLNWGLGKLTILDIDDPKLFELFKDIETFTVQTARKGYHLYFWSEVPISEINVIEHEFGLDIQLLGSGIGYGVLPPSYVEYEDGHKGNHKILKDCPMMDVRDLKEFVTERLIAAGYKQKERPMLQSEYSDFGSNGSERKNVEIGDFVFEYEDIEVETIVEKIKPLYIDGQRQRTTLSLCGWMYKAEIGYKSARKVINVLCDGDEEFDLRLSALNNSYRGLETSNLLGSSYIKSRCVKHVNNNFPDLAESKKEKQAQAMYYDISHLVVPEQSKLRVSNLLHVLKEGKSKDKVLNAIVNFLNHRYDIKVDTGTLETYIYDKEENYYKCYSSKEFQKFLQGVFDGYMFFKKDADKVKESFANLEDEAPIIAFENTHLSMETLEEIDPNPDNFVIFKVPYEYKADADGSFMEERLKEMLIDESGDWRYKFILQLFGYFFFKGNPYHILPFLLGEGSNGKSVITGLIRAIFGNKATGISVSELSKDFGLQALIGKYLNVMNELSSKHLNDEGILKTLTGEDNSNIRRKHKDDYEGGLKCKFLGIGNKAPRIDEDTYAIWRRVVAFEFPYRFVENPKEEYEKQLILNLKETLIQDKEGMTWLIYNAIQEFKKVETEGWAIELGGKANRDVYLKNSNPAQYAAEKIFQITASEEDFLSKDEIRTAITQFLQIKGLPLPEKDRDFYTPIYNMNAKSTQKHDGDRGYKFISYTNEWLLISDGYVPSSRLQKTDRLNSVEQTEINRTIRELLEFQPSIKAETLVNEVINRCNCYEPEIIGRIAEFVQKGILKAKLRN